MDQFDKKIKEELHTYLKNEINIEQKEKQRLNENMSRIHPKSPRKVRYYASIAGVLVIILLLATPMLKDFKSSKPNADKDNISVIHSDKESHLNEKEVPTVEDNEDDKTVEDLDETQKTNPDDKENEETAYVPLNNDEALAIIEGLFTNVRNVFSEASEKYGWSYERDFVVSEYGPLAEELRAFATEPFVQGHLLEVAKDYCFAGCDARFFPTFYGVLRPNISVNMADKITFSYIEVPNLLHFGHETTISLQKEGGVWKLSSIKDEVMDLIDYQITRKEADQLMSNVEGATFVKEVKGIHDRPYLDKQELSTKPFDVTIYIYYTPEHDMYTGIYSDDGAPVEDHVIEEYLE